MPPIRKSSVGVQQDSPRQGFRSLFGNIFSAQRPLFSLSEKVWNPPTDVYETCDSIIIKMEIAGVPQENIEITAEQNFLVIRGHRSEMTSLPKENYHMMEVRYGDFERVIGMPGKLDSSEINAQYQSGFLIVSVAKKPMESRTIAVDVIES